MWERFTERARQVVALAQEEASRLGRNSVDVDHLFLGLLREDDSMACMVLRRIMSGDLGKLRQEVKQQLTPGDGPKGRDMRLTTEAKRAIELAYDEARKLESSDIGTEHLLLGIACGGNSHAARALVRFGAEASRIRRELRAASGDETASLGDLDVLDNGLSGRDLLSIRDLSGEEVWKIFRLARAMKARTLEEQAEQPLLAGKTLAMIFEKPSLRTRVTFEVGMAQLGGHVVYLQPSDIQLGKRESVADAARNLERWVQGIMARTFAHKTVVGLAKHAGVPVINGLSDLEHPCQALTDFFTIYEKKGSLTGIKVAYIGDGCNTCHSLMLLAPKVGAHISVGCPEGYEPDTAILTSARREAKEADVSVSIVNDPFEAAKDADVVYTDVWASMGLESEREKRLPAFQPFQVNEKLVDAAGEDAIVMHCLPAYRGEEITDEVMDGPKSVVFDQAENRLHVQKAILVLLLK